MPIYVPACSPLGPYTVPDRVPAVKATPQTLRRVAHEIAVVEEENKSFRDRALFRLLRSELEFVIQDVGKTNWTVARSRRDLRGRTRRDRPGRQVHLDARLQQQLHDRLLPNTIDDPFAESSREQP